VIDVDLNSARPLEISNWRTLAALIGRSSFARRSPAARSRDLADVLSPQLSALFVPCVQIRDLRRVRL